LEGECLYGNNTQIDRIKVNTGNTDGTVYADIERLPLLAGKYVLNVAVVDSDGTPMDFYRNYCEFEVVSEDRSTGYFSIDHKWRI
ncbi:MAG: Wzt carbohydrate-binding domain-containing protein, partial [Ruminococcus sp.]|nr:Wzt carbohydrate-binding domain-containing protein [Ruminococcus sp.]